MPRGGPEGLGGSGVGGARAGSGNGEGVLPGRSGTGTTLISYFSFKKLPEGVKSELKVGGGHGGGGNKGGKETQKLYLYLYLSI